MKLAAIDVGSNSIKLVVVEAAAPESFAVLAREKDAVRLARGTLKERRLSAAAIATAAEVIERYRKLADARGAATIIAVATASVREAENAGELITAVESRARVRVEVLSGIEEARLIGVAASYGCATRGQTLVNIDIGGGSTEVSVVRDGVPAALHSVKLGAVALTEAFISSDPPKSKEIHSLKDEIRSALQRPARELRGLHWDQCTGTSGTILSLGDALHFAFHQDAGTAQGAGKVISLGELERLNEGLTRMGLEERRSIPGISSQRSEIVLAGGQILEGVMRALQITSLRTCDWALREGVLIDYLREREAELLPPVPDISDPKLLGVHAVGRRFGYEEAHAHCVAGYAEKIFDRMAPAYGFTRPKRVLLSAAALLHDVGYHIAHEAHHKHSLYLIKHSELTGFSEAERNVIANVARYHRGAMPKERHLDYISLSPGDRETVHRLAAILRIAEALDRNHDCRVRDIFLTLNGKNARLELLSEHDCDAEIWTAWRKSDLFEHTFQRKLTLSRRSGAANG